MSINEDAGAATSAAPDIDIVIDPAGFDKHEALLTLLRDSFAYMAARIDPPSSMNRLDLDGLREKAIEEKLIVAMSNGEPLACAFAKPMQHALYVGKVAVAPELRTAKRSPARPDANRTPPVAP